MNLYILKINKINLIQISNKPLFYELSKLFYPEINTYTNDYYKKLIFIINNNSITINNHKFIYNKIEKIYMNNYAYIKINDKDIIIIIDKYKNFTNEKIIINCSLYNTSLPYNKLKKYIDNYNKNINYKDIEIYFKNTLTYSLNPFSLFFL